MACPFTAATTGLRISKAAGWTGEAENSSSSRGDANGPFPWLKSAPTQNAGPAPVSTTARTSSSVSHA